MSISELSTQQVQELTLTVQQYCAATLYEDAGLPQDQVRAVTQYLAEYMARQLSAVMRVPAKVLQDHTVIAEYPSTTWDALKRSVKVRLGKLGCWIKYDVTQHRLSEHLLFPTVPIPHYGKEVRLYVRPELTSVTYPLNENLY